MSEKVRERLIGLLVLVGLVAIWLPFFLGHDNATTKQNTSSNQLATAAPIENQQKIAKKETIAATTANEHKKAQVGRHSTNASTHSAIDNKMSAEASTHKAVDGVDENNLIAAADNKVSAQDASTQETLAANKVDEIDTANEEQIAAKTAQLNDKKEGDANTAVASADDALLEEALRSESASSEAQVPNAVNSSAAQKKSSHAKKQVAHHTPSKPLKMVVANADADTEIPQLTPSHAKKVKTESETENSTASQTQTKTKTKLVQHKSWRVQVTTLSEASNVRIIMLKLKQHGFKPYEQKIKTPQGNKLSVIWIGNELKKNTAEQIAQRLKATTGLNAKVMHTNLPDTATAQG